MHIALRALRSWEKLQDKWEGGQASADAIFVIASEAIMRGYPVEGFAFLVGL